MLLSLTSIILFASCTKSETHIPVDPYLLSNFNHKVGSYWVYQDSLTGETDSFHVYRTDLDHQPLSSNNTGTKIDVISIDIREYDHTKQLIGRWQLVMARSNFSLYDSAAIIVSYPLVNIPFAPGIYDATGSDSANVISTNGSYSIDSVNYNNVVKFRHWCNDTTLWYPSFDVTYYMNATDGIVKMEVAHGTHRIWQLIRHQIYR